MYYEWAPYVPVAERRQKALKKMEALRKKGIDIQPVSIEGRKIAKTFWGEAWCDHLEGFSDFENRLPRGRTYVRNGSVCHLAIDKGKIHAKVAGSELYEVQVQIKTLPPKKWTAIKSHCGGQIGSLLELLQGRLSDHVMTIVTDRSDGLFPQPGEMSFRCSCPDWASMCKHVASVLYGVGARLDVKPELLFLLRGVDHEELIAADAEEAISDAASRSTSKRLATGSMSDIFGIDLDIDQVGHNGDPSLTTESNPKPEKKKMVKKTVKKKAANKKVAKKKLVKKKAKIKGRTTKTPTRKKG
jgi:uncharacterized Zn finger protein